MPHRYIRGNIKNAVETCISRFRGNGAHGGAALPDCRQRRSSGVDGPLRQAECAVRVAAIPFMLLHGTGNGMLTIPRDMLPPTLFGPAGYGLRTGVLAALAHVLQGSAPLLFGLVLDRGGPLAALLLSGTRQLPRMRRHCSSAQSCRIQASK